ncbi:hypothetical protein [Gemmatimonas groenlandica]|uniref:Uncharacterized protein n=1 Tax=Gemmatimonas groenlandica TaxID=2732249 RepID=A0A6M4IP21_9BACT|nr:hypothetical protein [Gemmatimonas groenlandica]QJR35775.1 hypothetical protein HKW67_09750 [Gemmatimonas groenlandica]
MHTPSGTSHANTPRDASAQERRASAWSSLGGARAIVENEAAAQQVRDPSTDTGSHRGGWPRSLLGVLRNAVVGLALLSAIPLALIGSGRTVVTRDSVRLVAQATRVDHLRVLRAPINQAISPQEAGAALRRLSTGTPTNTFPLQSSSAVHDRPWQRIELSSDMFPTMRTPQFKGPANFMVIAKTVEGYSAKEMAYLREVANAPVWADFDAVATAANVDLVGSMSGTTMSSKVTTLSQFPSISFSGNKQLAFAAVSRAAYYEASGDHAEAERVLRTLVSYGFTLIDQGAGGIDAMLGRVIVDIGRDGLWHFYTIRGRSEESVLVEPLPLAASVTTPVWRSATDIAADGHLPRTVRLEALSSLSLQSCGSLRTVLTGPSAATKRAISDARASMVRYPSEHALFDLIERSVEHGPELDYGNAYNPIVGIAQVVSAVTGNPRVANCTVLAASIKPN